MKKMIKIWFPVDSRVHSLDGQTDVYINHYMLKPMSYTTAQKRREREREREERRNQV